MKGKECYLTRYLGHARTRYRLRKVRVCADENETHFVLGMIARTRLGIVGPRQIRAFKYFAESVRPVWLRRSQHT